MSDVINNFGANYGSWVFSLAILWSLVWKGLALWKAAKNNSKFWFVLLLVVNTLGILEILYVTLFYKIDFEKYFKKVKAIFSKKN